MGWAGRPPIIESPEQFKKLIEGYFASQDKKGKPYNIVGIALACGFCDRHSFWEYSKKPEFSHTASWAKAIIENQRIENLTNTESKNVRGIEFDLKNNFGWKDKQEVDISGELTTKIIRLPKKKPEGAEVD